MGRNRIYVAEVGTIPRWIVLVVVMIINHRVTFRKMRMERVYIVTELSEWMLSNNRDCTSNVRLLRTSGLSGKGLRKAKFDSKGDRPLLAFARIDVAENSDNKMRIISELGGRRNHS